MGIISSSSSIFFIFFFIFLCPSQCNSLSFSIANNFTLYGDANVMKDAITLTTQEHNIQPSKRYGRALYRYPIRFLDPLTNTTASFSCRFSFTITPSPVSPCGDGLAFFITSNASSITTVYGHFGLPIHEMGSQESFFAVEFDTNFDPNLGDINDNHVGIDFGSVVSFASIGLDFWGINLKIGREITSWIQYEEKTKLLSVWVSNLHFKPRDPVISIYIDLTKKVFQEFMHIGFSASNGRGGSSRHVVESWQFNTSGLVFPKTAIYTETGEGAGCSICFDAHVAIQEALLQSQPGQGSRRIGIGNPAVGLGGALILLIFTSIALLLKWRKFFGITEEPRMFSLQQIEKATKHFSNRIGRGHAADVYRGSIGFGFKVAVKLYRKGYTGTNSYIREEKAMRLNLRHPNIVSCIGWGEEADIKFFIFEYMSKGSLRDFFPLQSYIKSCTPPSRLNWASRNTIIISVASALGYLHRRNITHGCVSASNVLLDRNSNAKLSKVGVVEFEDGCITKDVYSFGVLALEIGTGMTYLANRYQSSKHTVWQPTMAAAYESDLIDNVWKLRMAAADKKLKGKFKEAEMRRVNTVGLLCTIMDPAGRLTMGTAESILRGSRTCPVLV